MKISTVMNGPRSRKALQVRSLPRPGSHELKQLVQILSGESPKSKQLLKPTKLDTVASNLGATATLLLVMANCPEGGAYTVMDWVEQVLDKAMPKGMGAAWSVPGIWSTSTVKRRKYMNMLVISPMNRSVTDKIGAYVADPHWETEESIIPISVTS